jgi:hypothetical protein
MQQLHRVNIVIPADIAIADLRMARDPQTGDIAFDWTPIERICAASGIDVALFKESAEDNVGALLMQWYAQHRAQGGAPDAVIEDLIEETRAEDEFGGGLSHRPGRA